VAGRQYSGLNDLGGRGGRVQDRVGQAQCQVCQVQVLVTHKRRQLLEDHDTNTRPRQTERCSHREDCKKIKINEK
jgi:hypothetical protein